MFQKVYKTDKPLMRIKKTQVNKIRNENEGGSTHNTDTHGIMSMYVHIRTIICQQIV